MVHRLFHADREKTTIEFRNIWRSSSDGGLVFSSSKIGRHHIWIDMFMSSTIGVLISNRMHDALVSAGLPGLGFNSDAETESSILNRS